MKPQTNTETSAIMLADKGLTPEQQKIVLTRRFKEWNKPISLWTKITFGKERKSSTPKVGPSAKLTIAKKK